MLVLCSEKDLAEARVLRFMNRCPDLWPTVCGLVQDSADYPRILALLREAGLYELEAALISRKEVLEMADVEE